MKIEIINKSNHNLPHYETNSSAGMDLKAFLDEPIILNSLERKIIKTGLYISLPKGFEAQVRSRSGLSIKHGLCVLNSPGTIDADYRGELKVILINLGQKSFKIEKGLRIAQMVLCPVIKVTLKEVETLEETTRGSGGFGSTGAK